MTPQEYKDLILPMRDQMYRTAFLLLRQEDDAADIVQETFVRLWENRSELEGCRT